MRPSPCMDFSKKKTSQTLSAVETSGTDTGAKPYPNPNLVFEALSRMRRVITIRLMYAEMPIRVGEVGYIYIRKSVNHPIRLRPAQGCAATLGSTHHIQFFRRPLILLQQPCYYTVPACSNNRRTLLISTVSVADSNHQQCSSS